MARKATSNVCPKRARRDTRILASMSGTHEVLNQPPPLEDYNLYLTDPVLDAAVAREGAKDCRDVLIDFGAKAGSTEYYRWAVEANRNEPRLLTHDRFGRRDRRLAPGQQVEPDPAATLQRGRELPGQPSGV